MNIFRDSANHDHSGFGLGIVKKFLNNGAKVVIADQNKTLADEQAKKLGSNAFSIETDVSNELSKGKQNSLGETLKVVEHIQNNIKEIDKLFLCFFSNNSLVAMRAMNATKRIIKGDNHIFVENKKRFIDEFSESEHNVVKLGLITIYYDFISYFDDKEYKVISKNAMNWVENSKDWMILAQGLKLLEKLSNSDEILKSNVISIARQLKNDERKAVRSQAQKILKDT